MKSSTVRQQSSRKLLADHSEADGGNTVVGLPL